MNETYSCLQFLNPIGGFKDLYRATLVGTGSYKMNYSCVKYKPDYTWKIVGGVIAGVILIVGIVFGVKYLKKRKEAKEGQTTGGQHALLHNNA